MKRQGGNKKIGKRKKRMIMIMIMKKCFKNSIHIKGKNNNITFKRKGQKGRGKIPR